MCKMRATYCVVSVVAQSEQSSGNSQTARSAAVIGQPANSAEPFFLEPRMTPNEQSAVLETRNK
jgi:hypothetical protein